MGNQNSNNHGMYSAAIDVVSLGCEEMTLRFIFPPQRPLLADFCLSRLAGSQ